MAGGNLPVMLANQGVLALMNLAILVLINRTYAREGDTADAGRLAVVLSIMLAAVLLTTSGVARAVTLRISRTRADAGDGPSDAIARTVGGGLVLAAAIAAVLVAAGLALPHAVMAAVRAGWPQHADLVAMYVRPLTLGALWLPGYSMLLVMVAVFDGFQRMRWSLLAEAGTFHLLRFAAAMLVMLVAGWAWTGLIGAWAAAYTAGAALVAVELAVFLRRRGQRVAWRGLPLRPMLRDAALMFLPTIAPLLVSQTGVLVAWVCGGAAASAAFWVTWTVAIAAMEFCLPVGRVLFPAVPALARQADRRALGRAMRLSFWGVSGVMLAALVAMNVAKPWVLAYLHQGAHGAVLTVFLAAGFFEVHRTVFNPVLLATGRERALTLLEWAGLAAILIGGGIAMTTAGLAGLAGVYLVVYVASAAARVWLIWRATGVRMWLDAALTSALVLGVTAAVLAMEAGG
jgi:O-antigen/teichoic acid export membrane protein